MRPIAEAVHRHPFGQGVHYRRTHAVQAAGIGVVVIVKLAARVQAGIDQLNTADVILGMLVHGHAAAVVPYRGAAVLVQRHDDLGGVAAHRFVNAVIHDLPQKVMQAPGAGGADVHARTHAHGVQPLQYLEFAGVIAIILGGQLCHERILLCLIA